MFGPGCIETWLYGVEGQAKVAGVLVVEPVDQRAIESGWAFTRASLERVQVVQRVVQSFQTLLPGSHCVAVSPVLAKGLRALTWGLRRWDWGDWGDWRDCLRGQHTMKSL